MAELLNIHVVAGVVIEKDSKYLLVQEKQPKVYKKWNLPAGRVDVGETLREAAAREANEETGLSVEVGDELVVAHSKLESPVLHSFVGHLKGGEIKFPEDEILDVKWFSYEEVVEMKDNLRNPWVHESIKAYRKLQNQ